jgi:hypothetical protein
MTCPPYIRDALEQFAICEDNGESISVPTQCLYPSNGTVTVFVTGGPNGCVVSDEGRAIQEIIAHGFEVPQNVEAYLRQFTQSQGLRITGSKIHTPPIPADALAAAISLVANASSLAAFWAIKTFRSRVRRDLREELRTLFGARFSRDRIKEEVHLPGESGRLYKFEFRVELGSRSLIVDGVFPDATAINTRAIVRGDPHAEVCVRITRVAGDGALKHGDGVRHAADRRTSRCCRCNRSRLTDSGAARVNGALATGSPAVLELGRLSRGLGGAGIAGASYIIPETPCVFPASREFGVRDEFAHDCFLSQIANEII